MKYYLLILLMVKLFSIPDGAESVFPSITLASWASIFTGEFPGKTGQLGNEFFDRGLATGAERGVPNEQNVSNPPGVVSYSSGSFPGFDAIGKKWGLLPGIIWSDFVPPMGGFWGADIDRGVGTDWMKPADPKTNPWGAQNRLLSKPPPTAFEYVKQYGRTVVQSNHYARGADLWLTHYANPLWNLGALGAGGTSSAAMDGMSFNTSGTWLDKHRLALVKGESFPVLWVYYAAGLDHDAHLEGVSAGEVYRKFFRETTDGYSIAGFVDKLKELGQFYNKVFLITSDHGHTEMAAPNRVTLFAGTPDERNVAPDVSCTYKLKGFNKQGATRDAEQANNNLHVWELGALLTEFAPPEKTGLLLLAPAALEGSGIKFTTDVNAATVVAALNGPMAHIYVKGASWTDDPDAKRLNVLTAWLRVMLGMDPSSLNPQFYEDLKKTAPRLIGSVEAILVRTSRGLPYTVVVGTGKDSDGNVTLLEAPLDGYFDSGRFVKATQRIEGMNHPDRSGDIILLMKSGSNDPPDDRYTSGVSCKSWHGSLNRTDSYVPFILSYPGGNAAELDKPIEAVCPGKQCEGNWKATDLIKKIIETQYSGK